MSDENPCTWCRDEDRAFYERELASFIPDKVFDAHCHPWCREVVERMPTRIPEGFPPQVTRDDYREAMGCLCPGRQLGGLFIAFPYPKETMTASNEWASTQAGGDPAFRCSIAFSPDDDPEWIRQEVRRLGAAGLKCYHVNAAVTPTWEADLPAYLPEPVVKVAHEEGLAITLHMVKRRAVADPSNLHWIRHYCQTYPDMKMILAHSARGFQPAHNLEGLPQLAGLDNLYFDCSANCEPIAHQAILRVFGHERLMHGTDFWVSHLRGRSLAVADSFLWLYGHTPVWGEKHTQIHPVLIGLENLRSLKWACWSEKLSDSQVEDIFWNNAAKLFGV